MDERIQKLVKYVCEHICVHAVMESDYLIEQCKECRLHALAEEVKKGQEGNNGVFNKSSSI